MTTAEAIHVLDEQQAVKRLLDAGWTRQPCKNCEGKGWFTVTKPDDPFWRKLRCNSCEGYGSVWTPPSKGDSTL